MNASITLTLAGAILLAGCAKPAAAPEVLQATVAGERIEFPSGSPQLAAIATASAVPAAARTVRLGGRLAWNEDVTVRVWSPLSGRVEAVAATIGATVRRGDDLVALNSPDYGQIQADLAKAATDLAQADKALVRTTELFEHGAAARKDQEGAVADRDRAAAERDRAQARLATLGGTPGSIDQLFRLRSPVDGVVVERNVSVGQELRNDAALANLPQVAVPAVVVSDPRRLWLWLDVPEAELDTVKPGMTVAISSHGAPGRTFAGVVEVVAPALDPQLRIGRVRAVVANPGLALRAEQYVSCELQAVQAQTQVEVPKRAVFLDGARWYVFVADGATVFSRHTVTVGAESDDRILISHGIASDQRVVTDGVLLLNDMLSPAG